MYFNEFRYDNELNRTLMNVRQQVHSNTAAGFWKCSSSTSLWHNIFAGLCYFTGTHLHIRDSRIGRNDSPVWVMQQAHRNAEQRRINLADPEMCYEDEERSIPYTYLTLCLIEVKGQITNTFETHAPNTLVTELGYTELTGYSLALKTSPRHRIRVYSRTITKENGKQINSVIVLSANPFYDAERFLLYRKIISILPLLDNRTEEQMGVYQHNRIPLFRKAETVNGSNAEEYTAEILEYLKEIPAFNDIQQMEMLKTLKRLNTYHTASMENRIAQQKTSVQQCEESLRQALLDLRTLEYELAGLADVGLSEEDLKLLLSKNIISSASLSNDYLYYTCTSPCLSFDKEAAKLYYKKLADKETVFAKLFKLAFIDEAIVFMFTDCISLNFRTISYSGNGTGATFPQVAMRNPHHYHYNCWGNYGPVITKLLKQYSFMQLFLQIKAAVGSLNMTDYTVLSRFKEDVQFEYDKEKDHWPNPLPFIVWKEEKDMNKLHSISDTLNHFYSGGTSNETN